MVSLLGICISAPAGFPLATLTTCGQVNLDLLPCPFYPPDLHLKMTLTRFSLSRLITWLNHNSPCFLILSLTSGTQALTLKIGTVLSLSSIPLGDSALIQNYGHFRYLNQWCRDLITQQLTPWRTTLELVNYNFNGHRIDAWIHLVTFVVVTGKYGELLAFQNNCF